MKTRTLLIGLTFTLMGEATTAQCLEGDINGDGVVNGIDLTVVLQNWGQSCPAVIHAVQPGVGLPAGGTSITITGEQLGTVQSVMIGGIPATNVIAVDATTVTAVTPPSKSLGPKDVVVTTTGGSATLAGGFTYSTLDWGTVLDFEPDPSVITDPEWRDRIIATGLPWRVRHDGSGIEMLLVPPGAFMMGCSPSELQPCVPDESPVHHVTLTQPFYLGRYEVTQYQWSDVMGANPSYFQTASLQVSEDEIPFRPVEQVSWDMIQEFESATGLRLPTEAEWEYAARAGTQTAYNLPPDGTNADSQLVQLGWYYHNAISQTRPVGQKLANNLGLHDMHGNVEELCEDWYHSDYYASSPEFNPPGPEDGSSKVYRGGGWSEDWRSHRSSKRRNFWGHAASPSHTSSTLGFRAAKTP